jgi:sec-independent protein translocase protein TatA
MPGILLFFDISGGELMVILLVAFLVFGPNKIPEIARKIGKGMNEIRRASDEIKREINKEAQKLEMNTDGEGSPLGDLKKAASDLKKDLEGVTKPLNDPLGQKPETKPPEKPAEDLPG